MRKEESSPVHSTTYLVEQLDLAVTLPGKLGKCVLKVSGSTLLQDILQELVDSHTEYYTNVYLEFKGTRLNLSDTVDQIPGLTAKKQIKVACGIRVHSCH